MSEINSSEFREVVEEARFCLRSGPLDVAIERLKLCVESARKAGDPAADVFEAFVARLTPAVEIWDEAEREFDEVTEQILRRWSRDRAQPHRSFEHGR
jgi:hypothetical protein